MKFDSTMPFETRIAQVDCRTWIMNDRSSDRHTAIQTLFHEQFILISHTRGDGARQRKQ
jgi:hypothetical protein